MSTITKRVQRKTGETVYQAVVRKAGYPTKTKTFTTLDQAELWADRLELDIRDSRIDPRIVASRENLSGLVAMYLEEIRGVHKSFKDTESRLAYFTDRIGNTSLTKLTKDQIQAVLTGMTCGPATRNRYLGALSGCITHMSKTTDDRPAVFVGDNPCKLITRKQESGRRQRVLKKREWKELLAYVDAAAAAKGARMRAKQLPTYLRLAYAIGRRRGELMKLTWDCIDYDERVIYLLDTKTGDDQETTFTKPIKKMLKQHEAEFRRDGSPFVFPGRLNHVSADFDELIRNAMRELFKPDLRGEVPVFHTLRHTAATELGEAGATETQIMAVTGHKSSASVNRYVKQTRKTNRAAQKLRGV